MSEASKMHDPLCSMVLSDCEWDADGRHSVFAQDLVMQAHNGLKCRDCGIWCECNLIAKARADERRRAVARLRDDPNDHSGIISPMYAAILVLDLLDKPHNQVIEELRAAGWPEGKP